MTAPILKGSESISPGLRGTSYPGTITKTNFTLKWVTSIQVPDWWYLPDPHTHTTETEFLPVIVANNKNAFAAVKLNHL